MQKTRALESWNALLGYAWTRMLRGQGLGPTGTVIEIGPGFSDKIARGLAAMQFRGTVILVEPSEAAGIWSFERCRRLLPKAQRIAVLPSMSDEAIRKGPFIDAIVSNHILDDLILNAALEPGMSARIFSRMKPGASCSRSFVRSWRELLTPPERLEKLLAEVAENFIHDVARLQPRVVMLNQYPSWRHNQHGLSSIHVHALRLMQLMETILEARTVDVPVPGSSNKTLVRWLIGNPRAKSLDVAKIVQQVRNEELPHECRTVAERI